MKHIAEFWLLLRIWRSWKTISSSYSGKYQENSITLERRYVEGSMWEKGRPHCTADQGWLQGLSFGEARRLTPLPPADEDD